MISFFSLYALSFSLLFSLTGRVLSEGRTSSNAWCSQGCEDVSTRWAYVAIIYSTHDFQLFVQVLIDMINYCMLQSIILSSIILYLSFLPFFYLHLCQHPEVQKVIAKIEEVTYVPRANYESLQVRVLLVLSS